MVAETLRDCMLIKCSMRLFVAADRYGFPFRGANFQGKAERKTLQPFSGAEIWY